jgi:hypothetical protein
LTVLGWRECRTLDLLRKVLATGVHEHLMHNMLIRSIVGLGEPPVVTVSSESASRNERRDRARSLDKWRFQHRARSRDSKSQVVFDN